MRTIYRRYHETHKRTAEQKRARNEAERARTKARTPEERRAQIQAARAKRPHVTPEELDACRKDIRLAKKIRGKSYIVCLECGQLLAQISHLHLRDGHSPDAPRNGDEYRVKWGYNLTTSLCSYQYAARKKRELKRRGISPRFFASASHGHRTWTRIRKMRKEGRQNFVQAVTGLPQPWHTDVSDFEIVELRLQGKTLEEIGQIKDISRRSVTARLQRLKFPSGLKYICERGAPITGQTVLDVHDAFKITWAEMAPIMGRDEKTIANHARRPDKTVPVGFAKRLQAARKRLIETATRRNGSEVGGRPSELLPAERLRLAATYDRLLDDLQELRRRTREQKPKTTVAIQDLVCRACRKGAIKSLLFWPEFFHWIKKNHDSVAFAAGKWKPHDIALDFLASDYGLSTRTVERHLARA